MQSKQKRRKTNALRRFYYKYEQSVNRQYVMTSGFVGSWIYLYTTDRNKSNGNRDYRIQKEVIKWIITQFM